MNLSKTETDEAVVERARRAIAQKRKLRWGILAYGVLFLGFCFWAGSKVIERLEGLSQQEVTAGFVAGFGLAITCATFGVVGGLCIAKFLVGFDGEFRSRELLVRYYDRLREVLGADFK